MSIHVAVHFRVPHSHDLPIGAVDLARQHLISSHLMANLGHHHRWSHTSEVQDGTSWAQDNPVPLSYGARDYDAYWHHIHRGNEEVFTEQFVRAMSGMVSCYRRATNPDSQQFCQEVRATAISFAKQIAAQAGARASCSLLRVKGRAYSDSAGHEHQQ